MCCQNGYQFRMGEQHDIVNGEDIEECKNGFHLCLTVEDVFNYYHPGRGNRYFKVRALVRKEDFKAYGTYPQVERRGGFYHTRKIDKLVAKSIVIVSELPTDELYAELRKKYDDLRDLNDNHLEIVVCESVSKALSSYRTEILVNDGYSETFAKFIGSLGSHEFNAAHAVSSLEGLSMDMKVFAIMNQRYED